jgi:hypothetical protein
MTNEFPNTTSDWFNNTSKSYSETELCSNDTTRCMKGAITYAMVYVPVSVAVGSNVA